MTTSTQPAAYKQAQRKSAAFTLVEVMIAAAIGAMLMSAVMGTVFAITKAGYSAESYSDIETQARRGLELFARDVRMANTITWNSTTNITLRIPNAPGSGSYNEYVYAYSNGSFLRTQTQPTASAAQTLFAGIDPTSFKLTGYKISIDPATLSPYPVDLSNLNQASIDTKQIQLSVKLVRARTLTNQSTGDVISARFILRNKQVAN